MDTLTTEKSIRLFEKFGIFTEAELRSRAEVLYETYAKTVNIEALTMLDMANKQIIPAVIQYATTLGNSINTIRSACDADVSVQTEILMEVSDLLTDTKVSLARLQDAVNQGVAIKGDNQARAKFYQDEVVTAMEARRAPVDKLEMLVDKEAWPMPSYGDLIFEV